MSKQKQSTIQVDFRVDTSAFTEALLQAARTIRDKFWWMFYEEDLAESHGDAEDVWI